MSSTQKGTILLVEDEAGFRRVFQDALTYDGYNVLVAGDGESGWQLAKSEKPDLILLDLVLPKLHGFEVLRNVRADATTKDTPVIVVTVLGEEKDIRKGLELGANDYIVKGSYSPSEILMKIRLELHLKLKIGVQILVIERDEVVRAELGSTLEEAGFEVAVAANPLDGLNKLYESRPHLVIMAEDVGGVNGEELCSRVREVSYLPIIVLGSDEEVAGQMLEAGADAYMIRPPNTAELVARVHSLLRRRKTRLGGDKIRDVTSI